MKNEVKENKTSKNQNKTEKEGSAEQKKVVLLRLMQILLEYSDGHHPLKQDEIADLLWKNYGINVERKSIGRNLQLLRDTFDKDGVLKPATAITLETGGHRGSYVSKRLFEDSELRLLIDSVMASKHISATYSKDMIEKLCSMSNKYFKSHVKHVCSVADWGKTNNPALFLNIEDIDVAIESGKKISFDYNKYGMDKKLHKTKTHIGSPYQFVLHNQKYYLVFGDDKWDDVGYLRLDKITNVTVLEDPVVPLKSKKGYENGIDYSKISCALPYMFGDKMQRVTFGANPCIVDDIVDYFGDNAKIKNSLDGELEVTVTTSPNAMEYWAMQYLKFVEIKSPAFLRDRLKENVKRAVEKYDRD